MPNARRIDVAASPQERADACLQLLHGKRLHQIVIGSAVKSLYAFIVAAATRQNQHRRRKALRSKTAEHVETIELGETQIEHDQIKLRSLQLRIGCEAIVDAIDGVACLPQRMDED